MHIVSALNVTQMGGRGRGPMRPEEGQGNHHLHPQESSDISSKPSHSDFSLYKYFRLHGSCTLGHF